MCLPCINVVHVTKLVLMQLTVKVKLDCVIIPVYVYNGRRYARVVHAVTSCHKAVLKMIYNDFFGC